LEELNKSQNDVNAVAEHCKNAFHDGKDEAAFKETQDYVTQVLQTVVYNIHNVSLQVSNYVDVQFKEIDKLDLQIRTLADRMKSCHDATGNPSKQSMELPKTYHKSEKMRKLEDLPESAQPLEPYTREPIDLSALDDVGSSGSSSHTVTKGDSTDD